MHTLLMKATFDALGIIQTGPQDILPWLQLDGENGHHPNDMDGDGVRLYRCVHHGMVRPIRQ